jgi:hypothetical protein
MTNLEAYMAYCTDVSVATVTLTQYSIDPTGSDMIVVSGALGMVDRSFMPDYKQGQTSETMSEKTRAYLRSRGNTILEENGIEFTEVSNKNMIYGSGF